MKKLFTLLFCLSVWSISYAQNNVGINTTTPAPSAALDVQSNTQGILVPRMGTTGRTAIANPAKSLLVFDSTVNAYFYYDGSAWIQMGTSSSSGSGSAIGPRTKGKKMATFGDSITDTSWQANWPTYMQAMLGVQPVINKALSGAILTSNPGAVVDGGWWENQVATLAAEHPADDIDIIVVAIGTNDLNFSAPIGTYDQAMAFATLADLHADFESKKYLMPACRMNMWEIVTRWPSAKKYFSLPLQRVGNYAAGGAPGTPELMLPYLDAIAQMARAYGFIIIDSYGESGITWQVEKDYNAAHPGQWLYTIDGEHPSASGTYNGSQRLAELIAGKILSTF